MNWQEKCELLFGWQWKAPLARMAGINIRTVSRWSKGETQIKSAVVDKIDATYDLWRVDIPDALKEKFEKDKT